MTDKLSVYRGVARACDERRLSSLTENVKIRRLIDGVWDDPAGLQACLQAAFWNFAMETASFTYSPSITPAFGFQYAFDKPDDWLRTFIVSDDEMFSNRQFQYDDRGDYWMADCETIYVKYLSKSVTRGMDLSLWTPGFCDYVHHHLASLIVGDLESSKTSKDDLEMRSRRKLNIARATDAMDESMRFRPQGSWSRARQGSSSNDGGNRTRLIG
jgi:hypothetical protein